MQPSLLCNRRVLFISPQTPYSLADILHSAVCVDWCVPEISQKWNHTVIGPFCLACLSKMFEGLIRVVACIRICSFLRPNTSPLEHVLLIPDWLMGVRVVSAFGCCESCCCGRSCASFCVDMLMSGFSF